MSSGDSDVLSDWSSLFRTRKASRLIPSSSRSPLFSNWNTQRSAVLSAVFNANKNRMICKSHKPKFYWAQRSLQILRIFEDIKLQIIRYSKSSELYVDKCYSEIVPQVADAFYFLQIDEPQHIFTSEKLCLFKRPFYTQSCWVLIFMPVNLKCSSIFPAFCWPHPNFFYFFIASIKFKMSYCFS